MKKQSRISAITLTCAMAITALTGCGGKEKDEPSTVAQADTTAVQADTTAEQSAPSTTEGTKAPEEVPTETATETPTEEPTESAGPIVNFRDRSIEIVTGKKAVLDGTWRDGILLDNGLAEPRHTYHEDLRDQISDMEEKYKFKVSMNNIGSFNSDYSSKLILSINSGMPLGQLCEIDAGWVPGLMNNRLLTPLDTLSWLDLSEEKWNKGVYEATSFGGHVYGMNVDREPGYGVFYNKRILQEAGYGADELYDLQKNGEWDRAKFEEILKACTKDTDGDGRADIWGLTTSLGANYYTAVVHASGADFVTKDESGKFVNRMGSETFLSALDWADEMRKDYGAPPLENTEGMTSYTDRFINGQVAMTVASEKYKEMLSSLQDDWGFVMLPGPDGKNPIAVDPSPVIIIPASYSKDEANEIAIIFDLITETVHGYGHDEAWKEEYYEQYRDSRAVDETLTLMRYGKNIKPRLELFVEGLYEKSIYSDFLYPLYSGKTTPAEGIQANMEKWNELINQQNDAKPDLN